MNTTLNFTDDFTSYYSQKFSQTIESLLKSGVELTCPFPQPEPELLWSDLDDAEI